jgi:hypothetical protein
MLFGEIIYNTIWWLHVPPNFAVYLQVHKAPQHIRATTTNSLRENIKFSIIIIHVKRKNKSKLLKR